MSISKDIPVVLEQDLSVAVGVRDGHHVDAMHLIQERHHVGTGDRREKHELEVDPLDFSFRQHHFVFEHIE